MCDPTTAAYVVGGVAATYYANRQAKKQAASARDAVNAMNVRNVDAPVDGEGNSLDPISLESEEANRTVRKAKDQEAKRSRLAIGQQSTILTNPLGIGPEAKTKKQTLIGV